MDGDQVDRERQTRAVQTCSFSTSWPDHRCLQRAIARGDIDADIDLDMVVHVIQGALISQRIVDDRAVSDGDLGCMLDTTLRALGTNGNDP